MNVNYHNSNKLRFTTISSESQNCFGVLNSYCQLLQTLLYPITVMIWCLGINLKLSSIGESLYILLFPEKSHVTRRGFVLVTPLFIETYTSILKALVFLLLYSTVSCNLFSFHFLCNLIITFSILNQFFIFLWTLSSFLHYLSFYSLIAVYWINYTWFIRSMTGFFEFWSPKTFF